MIIILFLILREMNQRPYRIVRAIWLSIKSDYIFLLLSSSPRVNEAELEGFVGYGFFLFSYNMVEIHKQIVHLVHQFNSSRLWLFATLYSW